VLGAISTKAPGLVYHIASKSEQGSYKRLLHKIVAYCNQNQLDLKNTVLIQDNVKYHHNKACKDYLYSKGIGLLFLPPKSSAFNGIE
jgi:transposase